MLSILLSCTYWLHKLKHREYPLSIIYFHHVFKKKNPYHPEDICEADFYKKINFLTKHFTILPIYEAIELQDNGKLPPKSLVITFDDGYIDNYTVAAPILERLNCTATFFISSEGIEKGVLWNDTIEQVIAKTDKKEISHNIMGKCLRISNAQEKVSAYSAIVNNLKFKNAKERNKKVSILCEELQIAEFSRSMMNTQQVKDLSDRGFTIGAHTHSHTILTTETNDNCHQELLVNKNYLENVSHSSVNFLAYPNGLRDRDFDESHMSIAKRLGFKAAFSTNDGGAISSTNKYAIPRFMPYRKQLHLFALSIAKIAGEHV